MNILPYKLYNIIYIYNNIIYISIPQYNIKILHFFYRRSISVLQYKRMNLFS